MSHQRALNAIKGFSTDEINNLKVGNEGVGISHLTWLENRFLRRPVEYLVRLEVPCKGKFCAENA